MRKATIKRFTAPDYSGTEAINTICTNLSFSGRNCKRIAFTSYMPGAGKTYISINVLYNLAKRGKRVLLVDASPMTLIDTPYCGEMLDHLATQFDLVLVDTPPVGVVIDAAEIGRRCDGCVLIVNYNTTRRRELVEAKNQMEQSGCPVLGCVINKVTFDTLSAKKYYNKGYYNHYYKSGYYGKSNDE